MISCPSRGVYVHTKNRDATSKRKLDFFLVSQPFNGKTNQGRPLGQVMSYRTLDISRSGIIANTIIKFRRMSGIIHTAPTHFHGPIPVTPLRTPARPTFKAPLFQHRRGANREPTGLQNVIANNGYLPRGALHKQEFPAREKKNTHMCAKGKRFKAYLV